MPDNQRISTSLFSKFSSGCMGAIGVLVAIVLVCGGGIAFLMNSFDNDEDDDNPVQRGEDNPIAIDDAEQPPFALNEVAAAESVNIAVTKAEVGIVPLIDFLGEDSQSEDPALVITFQVENTDERKIVRRIDNAFVADRPRLEDDAGNVIRGVSYGGGKPKGEMNADLNPGDSTSHVEVFMIPPPATEFLLLTVDFAMFGSEGEATFRINVEEIDGWAIAE